MVIGFTEKSRMLRGMNGCFGKMASERRTEQCSALQGCDRIRLLQRAGIVVPREVHTVRCGRMEVVTRVRRLVFFIGRRVFFISEKWKTGGKYGEQKVLHDNSNCLYFR